MKSIDNGFKLLFDVFDEFGVGHEDEILFFVLFGNFTCFFDIGCKVEMFSKEKGEQLYLVVDVLVAIDPDNSSIEDFQVASIHYD